MTTREIANTLNKDISTIQKWIKKLSGKNPSIDGKMQSSSPMHPADFDLDETLLIIETGMGKNAADIYRANVGVSVKQDRLHDVMQLIPAIVSATVSETVKQLGIKSNLQSNQPQLQNTTRLLSSEDVTALRKQFVDGVNLLVQKQKPNPTPADYRNMFNTIYYNIMATQGTDIKGEAYKQDMHPIDWAEQNGYLQYCVNEVQNLLRG